MRSFLKMKTAKRRSLMKERGISKIARNKNEDVKRVASSASQRVIASPSVNFTSFSHGRWKKIPCCMSELRLDLTLPCGQAFRWSDVGDGTWQGVIGRKVFTLKQDADELYYQTHGSECSTSGIRGGGDVTHDQDENILRDYFQLEVDIGQMFGGWAETDPAFARAWRAVRGVRILRQDPVENLITFITSSNNNIARITSLLGKLCAAYGDPIATVAGVQHYSFPTLEGLAGDGVEDSLRGLGFGYRAKFISRTCRTIVEERKGGTLWLRALRDTATYGEAFAALKELCGVGAKVADCVCLMSLDKPEAVPVDTHVWQITQRDYQKEFPGKVPPKSMTETAYQQVGDFYRNMFGRYAGWAQAVLFAADLKPIRERGKK